MPYELEHHTVATNGLQLHVVQCGPTEGPLVILLHGFPEFWYGWRQQLQPLAAAGYRVWAPDQRGYNRSDKPRRVRDYRMGDLVADVLGLIDAAGREQAAVVGHDWGAAVAWHLAALHPGRVSRVAVLNVPHPQVLAKALRHDGRQRRRSWYILFFQLPWLPEALIRLRGGWLGRQTLLRTSRRGTFGPGELAQYQAAWRQPGALRSMLHWYRAAARHADHLLAAGRVSVPVHIIWGEKDAFLRPELARQSLDFCAQAQLTYLRASHWVQHEEAAAVNRLLLDFLAAV